MSIKQNYLGSSPMVTGASILQQNAELIVQEGYINSGGSFVGITLGKFYIDSIIHNTGTASDSITISASNSLKKAQRLKSVSAINYEGQYRFSDDFGDGIYSDNWRAVDNNWGEGSSAMTCTTPAAWSSTFHTTKTDLSNFCCQFRFRANSITSPTATALGLYFRNNGQGLDAGEATDGYYYFAYMSSGASLIALNKYSAGAGSTTLSSAGLGWAANTDYWMRVVAIDAKMYFQRSTDGIAYTTYLSAPVVDYEFSSGHIGFGCYGSSTIFTIRDFELYTLTRPKTIDWLVKDVAISSGIDSVNTPNYWEPSFTDSTGLSAWNIGTSFHDNIMELRVSPGNSNALPWSSVQTVGTTFNNFAMEFEFYGESRSVFAPIVGIGLSHGSLKGFYWQGNGTRDLDCEFFGITQRFSQGTKNIDFSVIPNQWHKGLFIKKDDWTSLAIDNVPVIALSDAEKPTSVDIYKLSTGGSPYNRILFGMYNQGGISAMWQIKNLRIMKLGDDLENFDIQPNSSMLAAIDRLCERSNSYYYMHGDTLTFKMLESNELAGSSWHGVSDPTFSIMRDKVDDKLSNHIYVVGEDNITASKWNWSSYDKTGQERVDLVSDETIGSYQEGVDYLDKLLDQADDNSETVTLTIPAQPTWEIGDVIKLSDFKTGASGNWRITSFYKTMDVRGQYTGTYTLSLI